MWSSLLDKIVDLLPDVGLLSMCELHASQFVIDSLNHNLRCLIQFLSARFFSGLAAFLHELNKLFFFKFAREFGLSVVLVLSFLRVVVSLISVKNMFNYLVSCIVSLTANHAGWYKLLLLLLLLLLYLLRIISILIVFLFVFVLFEDLRVEQLERDQWIINKRF